MRNKIRNNNWQSYNSWVLGSALVILLFGLALSACVMADGELDDLPGSLDDEPADKIPDSPAGNDGVASKAVLGTYAIAWAQVDRENGILPSFFSHNLRVDSLDTDPFRQYSTPANSSVTKLDTGFYRVTFPNIAVSGGTVHVTAYGGNHHCKVNSWGPSGGGVNVYARCFNSGGTAAGGKFTVLYYRDDDIKSDIGGHAYLWANLASAASYTPSLSYQFNSRGAVNTVSRLGTGDYLATLPSMQRHWLEPNKGGTVQVTAYGSTAERCKVRYWTQSGNDILVRVGCVDASGGDADSRFTLSFMRGPGDFAKFVAEDTQERYYVWANTTPTPSCFYQSDSYGNCGATMEYFAASNTYRVHLPGVEAYYTTNAQVTAYGWSDAHCTISGWYSDPVISGAVVDVRCFNSAGTPVTSIFTLLYSTDRIILY